MSALTGRRVVITRAERQWDELSRLLCSAGATLLPYPSIKITPPADPRPFEDSAAEAIQGGFTWLVVTSANTVDVVAARCAPAGHLPPAMATMKIAAIGKATARSVRAHLGREVDCVARDETAAGLAASIPLKRGDRVWLPQSSLANGQLAASLAAHGTLVTAVDAYQTATGSGGVDLPRLLERGEVDAVTFTSGSTVDYFIERLSNEGGNTGLLNSVTFACLGATAVSALSRHGLAATIVAPRNSLGSLVEALESHFALVARSAS